MVQTKRNDSNDRRDNNDNNLNTDNISQMEKGLKIWHAFVGLFGVFLTVVTLIINQSNKIETQRLRIEILESITRDHGLMMREMANKGSMDYNEIKNTMYDIKIMLQNKADRDLKK
jgi:hypothetical protein